MISSRPYHLYIKRACPFCQEAMKLLEEYGLPYTVTMVDKNEELLSEVKGKYNWKTVPIVLELSQVHGVRLIGGYTDLKEHLGENVGKDRV